MVNEENVKHFITGWLKAFDVEVYWEKKNAWDYPLFKCDTKIKPDLIIKKKHQQNGFAVEVKDADDDMNLLNAAPQILKYAKEPIIYSIDDRKVQISGYLVASQFSINGKLYKIDSIKPVGEGRAFAISQKQIPNNEYVRTLDFIRSLWRFAKDHAIDKPTGALLSESLNNKDSIAPLLFFKTQKWSSYMIWDKFKPLPNPFMR